MASSTIKEEEAAADDSDEREPSSIGKKKNPYKDPDDGGRQRFLLELEFVQCLANPTYINYLAQNRYFEDEAFIGYLKYLQYWKRPEYIKFIMYPHCLFFLDLLQNVNFRNAMAHPGNKELAHRQQYFYWKNHRNNRLKHILPRQLPEAVAEPAPTPAAAPASAPAQAPPLAPAQPPPPPALAPSPSLAPLPPMTAASPPVHSAMQFMGQSASSFPRTDVRNNMGDRRKRKKDS